MNKKNTAYLYTLHFDAFLTRRSQSIFRVNNNNNLNLCCHQCCTKKKEISNICDHINCDRINKRLKVIYSVSISKNYCIIFRFIYFHRSFLGIFLFNIQCIVLFSNFIFSNWKSILI